MDLSQLQKYNNSLEDSLYYDNQGITEIDIKNVCEYYPEKLYNFDQNSKKLEDVEKTILSFIHDFKLNKLCVSLSGGVDSMVTISVLKFLKDTGKLDIDLCAFHLNYNNRKESVIEMEMIKRYCNTVFIPLYIYNIEHIHRNDKTISRKKYEKITRDIRFGCYKEINMPIALGHEDDIIENIITRFSYK